MGSTTVWAWLGFKASETLLGIETGIEAEDKPTAIARFKASETLLGIETDLSVQALIRSVGFKASETLLGIETQIQLGEH